MVHDWSFVPSTNNIDGYCQKVGLKWPCLQYVQWCEAVTVIQRAQ